MGELHFGARKSSRVETNIARIDELTASLSILDCDITTAYFYGQIKNQLRIMGRPIPENDIWIAAIAQQYQMILVSRDAHFRDIPDLLVEGWQPA